MEFLSKKFPSSPEKATGHSDGDLESPHPPPGEGGAPSHLDDLHSCPLCDRWLRSSRALNIHLIKVHPKIPQNDGPMDGKIDGDNYISQTTEAS